ncbi:MAG: hypothetical protein ACE5HD_03160 [Acidobacteriota bacterium]
MRMVPSRMKRLTHLAALVLLGTGAGYLGIAAWQGRGAASTSKPAPAAAPPPAGADPSTAGASPVSSGSILPALPPDPSRRSSSIAVVGGMTSEEARRRGIHFENPADAAALPKASPSTVVAPQTSPTASQRKPAAAKAFPAAVQAASTAFYCLCGCGDNLAVCDCNEQPVGAVSMLTYLEKLLDRGLDGADLHAAMVDRYGERVLASAKP